MMLTPEQLEYLRGMRFEESCGGLSVGSDAIVAHIDAQQARIAELEAKADDLQQSLHLLMDKAAELEQDAARYRWLRDLPEGSEYEEIGNYPSYMWDEAIDAAMQK